MTTASDALAELQAGDSAIKSAVANVGAEITSLANQVATLQATIAAGNAGSIDPDVVAGIANDLQAQANALQGFGQAPAPASAPAAPSDPAPSDPVSSANPVTTTDPASPDSIQATTAPSASTTGFPGSGS